MLLVLKMGTNLKRDFGNTEGSLCDPVQLKRVIVLIISIWES